MNDPSKGYKEFLGQRERQCLKCGFATFSLIVLYKHRNNCHGKQLGPGHTCSFCKRKFTFFPSFKRHQSLCVRKTLKRRLLKEKQRAKRLGFKAKHSSFSCPICEASFTTKHKFVDHLKEQSCQSPKKKQKMTVSARKSTSRKSFKSAVCEQFSELSWPMKDSTLKHDDELYNCKWCKSYYPTQKLLNMHMEMNKECSEATNRSKLPKKPFLKARKSIGSGGAVAKKSFSKALKMESRSHKKTSRSARKSLPSSDRRPSYETSDCYSDPELSLKECPICFRCFTDVYTFFLHQKKMNHWGKATKSFNSTLKCPFCPKEFAQIFSRDAHVRNHSGVSTHKIKAFLKSHACSVCSASFASVLAKIQHERISACRHECHASSNQSYYSKPKLPVVPKQIKEKLKQKPNACPVCFKAFSHTHLRNKHFNEDHLRMFECQVCKDIFKSISSLNNHMKLSHTNEFECRGCKMGFKHEFNLLEHVLRAHPNKDPKLFLPSSVTTLPKQQQDKAFKVSIDSKKSDSQSPETVEFYCDICNIGYLKLCGLQSHRQSKLHKANVEKKLKGFHTCISDSPFSSVAPINPQKAKQPDILTCSECSAEFTSIKDFVPHRLSHFSVQGKYLRITELNPYMCEICSEVLDSHSQVQLHLFWHLQIESTAISKSTNSSVKKKATVPDRLSGQHVAKKSFSKHVKDLSQEVTIAGVTKPLFICEVCNVGFTTKEHYSLHVRKLCKKGKVGTARSINEAGKTNNKPSLEPNGMVHCTKCNFLFSDPVKHSEHKPTCEKISFDQSSVTYTSNLKAVKSALKNNLAVAGCVTCGAVFNQAVNVSHLSAHLEEKSYTDSDQVPEVQHCALCNSLFSLSAFTAHKEFCKIPLEHDVSRSENAPQYFKHTSFLKSALELRGAVAGCISCGESFVNLSLFKKHLNIHLTDMSKNDVIASDHLNGGDIFQRKTNDSRQTILKSSDMTESNDKVQALSQVLSPSENVDLDDATKTLANNNPTISYSIEELRENFSKLLCILIADSELMETLGFGELLVEDVLVNVLKQMGQKALEEPTLPVSETFPTNIMTLLNLCLKDTVMDEIGKDKTIEEIVIGALNIFDAD